MIIITAGTGYAYLLTPTGVSEKTGLTARFLARKLAEYESLRREIETLKYEIHQSGSSDGYKQVVAGALGDSATHV